MISLIGYQAKDKLAKSGELLVNKRSASPCHGGSIVLYFPLAAYSIQKWACNALTSPRIDFYTFIV